MKPVLDELAGFRDLLAEGDHLPGQGGDHRGGEVFAGQGGVLARGRRGCSGGEGAGFADLVLALDRYDDEYRRLAADNREFGVWASLTETHALGAALSGMSALLAEMSTHQPGHRPRTHLIRSYQAALDDPVIGSGQAPDGVVLPSLAEAYINPVCRVAEISPGDAPADNEWWQSRDLVTDAEAFFAGYLTSPRAVRAPLVVLGEPGSGKSKLAEILAARLPGDDFLPVLVGLRDVAAESMVLEQIEQAIYQRPGERIGWHELIEAAEGTLPVVLLDGFDELIQATSVSRYDYLEQIRDFQKQQAQIGCPVTVIVTSRTIVADQARFPAGSLALQLQPFTEEQVRRWLQIWDRCNADVLAERGLRPLPAATALAHRELAEQPLLLLLIAIFDAADNSLQRSAALIGRAELYERLLSEFALREISKSAPNRAQRADQQHQLATREVQRLAIVALAMFTRGQQSATEAELNQDLPALFPGDEPSTSPDADLTPAQRATGRFFFIHKSEARLRDERARSYEFLHATFGEFLVARAAVTALRDLADYRELMRRGTTAAAELDDGFLYAALSFSCLAGRAPIISFLNELLHQLSDGNRVRCGELLRDLITGSLYPHPSRSFQYYEPARPPLHRRLGVYSANLVLMLVLLADTVSASEFCGLTDTAKTWAQYGYLWRSALTSSEWRGVTDVIRARASRSSGPVVITLTREDGSPVSPTDSLVMTEQSEGLTHFDVQISPHQGITYEARLPYASLGGRIFRDLAFIPSWHSGMLLLQEIPFLQATTGGEIRFQASDGTLALPGYMLAHLDYTRGAPPEERIQLYDSYATAMTADPLLLDQFLLRLQQEIPAIQPGMVIYLLRKVNTLPPSRPYVAIMNRIWREPAHDGTRKQLAALVRDIHLHWPDNPLDGLDSDLRNVIGGTQPG